MIVLHHYLTLRIEVNLIPFNITAATDKWYSEVNNYDFENSKESDDPNKPSGHFTNMVSKRAKKVGFGYSWKKQTDSD